MMIKVTKNTVPADYLPLSDASKEVSRMTGVDVSKNAIKRILEYGLVDGVYYEYDEDHTKTGGECLRKTKRFIKNDMEAIKNTHVVQRLISASNTKKEKGSISTSNNYYNNYGTPNSYNGIYLGDAYTFPDNNIFYANNGFCAVYRFNEDNNSVNMLPISNRTSNMYTATSEPARSPISFDISVDDLNEIGNYNGNLYTVCNTINANNR